MGSNPAYPTTSAETSHAFVLACKHPFPTKIRIVPMNAIFAQHAENGSLLERYLDLITDPAHLLLELTLVLVIDVLVVAILWPFIIKPLADNWLNKHFSLRDSEHGHNK